MNNGLSVLEYKDKIVGLYSGKFLPFHKGHLECIMKASKMVDVLFVVVGYDDEWDKQLCENTKFKWVSNRVRERWITEELRNYSNIRVLSQYEKRSVDYMNDPSIIVSNNELREKVGGRIDVVFSSEPEYEEYFKLVQPNTKHVIIDPDRLSYNVSATEIREAGIHSSWSHLPDSVRKHYIKRVCVCGIESTGKTTLVKKLANAYLTNYVLEYGRIYCEELNGCHDIIESKDLVKIAIGHNHNIELAVLDSDEVLFIDTDNVYTQFFSYEFEDKLNEHVHNIINSNVDEIDLYLYIEPTIPHELDGMRKEKSWGRKLEENEILKELYATYGKELVIINDPNDLQFIFNEINKILI